MWDLAEDSGRGLAEASGPWEDAASVPNFWFLTSELQNWMLEPTLATGEELPELTLLTTLLEGPTVQKQVRVLENAVRGLWEVSACLF